MVFFFSSRRRHTRFSRDWSSDVCSSDLLVVLGPEHAATIAGDGLSRADVQRFVYENARQPLGLMRLGGMYGMHDWPAWMNATTDAEARLPRVPSPDDIFVIV